LLAPGPATAGFRGLGFDAAAAGAAAGLTAGAAGTAAGLPAKAGEADAAIAMPGEGRRCVSAAPAAEASPPVGRGGLTGGGVCALPLPAAPAGSVPLPCRPCLSAGCWPPAAAVWTARAGCEGCWAAAPRCSASLPLPGLASRGAVEASPPPLLPAAFAASAAGAAAGRAAAATGGVPRRPASAAPPALPPLPACAWACCCRCGWATCCCRCACCCRRVSARPSSQVWP
jgi:hypothetical protein